MRHHHHRKHKCDPEFRRTRIDSGKLWKPEEETEERIDMQPTLQRKLPSVEALQTEITPPNVFPIQKLIDDRSGFNGHHLGKAMLDYGPTFAVGIIGRSGVGKSTLSACLGNESMLKYSELRRSNTTGVDLGITFLERMFVLDTQAFTLLDARDKLTWMDIFSIRSCLFLFSVCDVVVVVSDKPADLELWKSLKKIDQLKQQLGLSDLKPSLVPLINMAKPELFETDFSTKIPSDWQTLQPDAVSMQPYADTNVLLVPSFSSTNTPVTSSLAWEHCVQQIMGLPRLNPQATERSWMRFAQQVWTRIQSVEKEQMV
ncbi:hypothetical protein EDD86DRAFT_203873 [Gorgonomyces haynaldii]|nr:hypothetical protein EDD86DRAFT_203873 [Gorgonomyces haynaldii]